MQDVLVAERTKHFFVTGHSADQIAACLRVMGPRREGALYGAFTDWSVRYSVGRACALVHVDVLTTLPRWIEPSRAPRALVQTWNAYLAGLIEHERGHRDIAVAAGRQLLAALAQQRGVDPAPTLRAILHRARADELQFDADTRHGACDPRISNLGSVAA